jgi:hypothetical protein
VRFPCDSAKNLCVRNSRPLNERGVTVHHDEGTAHTFGGHMAPPYDGAAFENLNSTPIKWYWNPEIRVRGSFNS